MSVPHYRPVAHAGVGGTPVGYLTCGYAQRAQPGSGADAQAQRWQGGSEAGQAGGCACLSCHLPCAQGLRVGAPLNVPVLPR